MGNGYPKYAAKLIAEAHPELDIEFINLGISGNRTDQLFDRMSKDLIDLKPDIVSILIGINDIWHRYGNERVMTTDEQIEVNYRAILERIRRETDAKIVMLTPYILDCEDKVQTRADLPPLQAIVRKLAEEYADVLIPLDEQFEEALKTQPEPHYYSGDAVHPNQNGAAFIGARYAEAIEPLLK
jgi:lysophospholipase L1-like esterase